jgi:hypothetical protein
MKDMDNELEDASDGPAEPAGHLTALQSPARHQEPGARQ